jgi:hypothetical protein
VNAAGAPREGDPGTASPVPGGAPAPGRPEPVAHSASAPPDPVAKASSASPEPVAQLASAPPEPRRTRRGEVVVGPTLLSRFRPGALYGLPLVAALLSPLGGAGIEQVLSNPGAREAVGPLLRPLSLMPVQLVLGWSALWLLFAVWALIPLVLVNRMVLLDENTGDLRLRRGLRTRAHGPVSEVAAAVGDPDRGGMAVIDFADGSQWRVPDVGWDGRAFDGLRVLQQAAGLPVAPDHRTLRARSLRYTRMREDQESAARVGMPWREDYAWDRDAFRTEFDRRRRVLGGKEPARPGDATPDQRRRRGRTRR